MQDPELLVGLDVGSTKVSACAGHLNEGGIEVVAVAEAPTSGVRKGMITDIEDTAGAISTVIEELERTASAPVSIAVAGIGGVEVTTIESKGVVAVARPDSDVTQDDVDRAIDAAKSVTLPPNREILHALPKYFTTDHDEKIHNPVGLTSIRLEVTSELVLVSSLALRNLEKTVAQATLNLVDIVFSPLATATAVLSKRQLESGVILLDLGACSTELVVFEEGQLIHSAIIPIGSQHLTNDLAIGIRTSLEVAEQIKRSYGSAMPEFIKASESIRLSDFDESERETVKRQFVSEILKARLDELFGLINQELIELDRDGKLPAGVILAGNGSKLTNLVEYSKENLKLPASIAHSRLELPLSSAESDKNINYVTSAGLLLWGFEHSTTNSSKSILPNITKVNLNMSGIFGKAKDVFKQFLP